jgi:hypothetical protein
MQVYKDAIYDNFLSTNTNKLPIYQDIVTQLGNDSGLTGCIAYQVNDAGFYGYNGTAWVKFQSGAGIPTSLTNLGGTSLVGNGLGPNLTIRGLTQGYGISILNTGNDLTISTNGEQNVPSSLILYVSANGNDLTGDGTFGNPFATLPRAFKDIRIIGYISSATVIIKNDAPFIINSGIQSLNSGTRGTQNAPIIISGESQTVLDSSTVLTATQDTTGSQLITINVSAPPLQPFAVGQIIKFTSGTLVGQSFYVANVASLTSILIAGSQLPANPDTFDILQNTTNVRINGIVGLQGIDDTNIVFQNLNVTFENISNASIEFINIPTTFLSGINITNLSANALLVNTNSYLQVGEFLPSTGTVTTPSYIGIFVDNSTAAKTFNQLSSDLSLSTISGSVFLGNATNNNLVIQGPFETVNNSYFSSTGGIQVQNNSATIQNLLLQNSKVTAAVITAASNSAELVISNIVINSSTASGIFATNTGRITLGANINITGAAVGGAIASSMGGSVICTVSPTFGTNVANCIFLFNGGQFYSNADITANTSTTNNGIYIDNGSVANIVGNVTCSGNVNNGIKILGGTLQVTGNVTASSNSQANIAIDRGRFIVNGNVIANTSVNGIGISIGSLANPNISTMYISGTLTCNTNKTNLSATLADIAVGGAADLSFSGIPGFFRGLLLARSTCTFYSTLTVNSITGINILMNTSILRVFGVLTTNLGTQGGISAGTSIIMSYGQLAASSNNADGVFLSNCLMMLLATSTSAFLGTDNNGRQLVASNSIIFHSNTLTAQITTTTTGSGFNFIGNVFVFGTAISVVETISTNTLGKIVINGGSLVVNSSGCSLTPGASGVGGTGLTISDSCFITSGSLTFNNCNVRGISITGSIIHASSITSSKTAGTGSGGVLITSSIVNVTGSITCAANINTNLSCINSIITSNGACSFITGTNTGLNLSNSQFYCNNSLTVSNCGTGMVMNCSQLYVSGILNCIRTTAGTGGISITNSQLCTASAVNANSNLTTGITATQSTITVGSSLNTNSNTGNGINAFGCIINVGSALSTSSNTLNGFNVEGSTVYVGTDSSCNLNTQNGINSRGSTIYFGSRISAGSNTLNGILLSNSRFSAGTGITTATNNSSGIDITGSYLGTLNISSTDNRSYGIVAKGSQIVGTSIFTVTGNNTGNIGSNNIYLSYNSQLSSTDNTLIGLDIRNSPNNVALLCESSTIVCDKLTAGAGTGSCLRNVSLAKDSSLTIITSAIFGLTTSGPNVNIDNSKIDINGAIFSGTAISDNLILQKNSSGKITNSVFNNATNNGITIQTSSSLDCENLTTTVNNGGIGMQVSSNSRVSYRRAPAMTITGPIGAECKVGANGITTWAIQNGGLLANVQDFTTATPEVCSLVPYT